jgi:hypothetical protein
MVSRVKPALLAFHPNQELGVVPSALTTSSMADKMAFLAANALLCPGLRLSVEEILSLLGKVQGSVSEKSALTIVEGAMKCGVSDSKVLGKVVAVARTVKSREGKIRLAEFNLMHGIGNSSGSRFNDFGSDVGSSKDF